jgi:hypothetical protein
MREQIKLLENHSHFLSVQVDIAVTAAYIFSFKKDRAFIRLLKPV